jgi:hypothetical protein
MTEFVTRSPLITRWDRAWLATLLLTLATLCATAACPERVLLVFREHSHVPAARIIDHTLQETLKTPDATDSEFYTEHHEPNRFGDGRHCQSSPQTRSRRTPGNTRLR